MTLGRNIQNAPE